MRASSRIFLSCLLCFVLPLASGYGNENNAPPAEQDRKAGERMVLTIQDMEYALRWCPPPVTLSCGFWMLETEVTQEMWEKVMGSNPSEFKGSKLPVEQVSWDDSQEYIKKLNDLGVAPAGYQLSLPTEEQWEYACRVGTTPAYHFVDTLTQQQAHFVRPQTSEVGSYPANVWGLKDMHGNVWEWCTDWFGSYPNGAVASLSFWKRTVGRN